MLLEQIHEFEVLTEHVKTLLSTGSIEASGMDAGPEAVPAKLPLAESGLRGAGLASSCNRSEGLSTVNRCGAGGGPAALAWVARAAGTPGRHWSGCHQTRYSRGTANSSV
jgi:hypothetical protein